MALPVCAACGLWLLARAAGQRRAALRALAAMGIAGAAVITPWSVRNSLIEGRLVVLRGQMAVFVANALAPAAEADPEKGVHTGGSYKIAWTRLGERDFVNRAAARMRGGPKAGVWQYLRGIGVRSTRFWIGDVWAAYEWYGSARVRLPVSIHHLKVAAHALPTVLALAGLIVGWRRREDVWLLFAQIAGFFPAYALLLCVVTRYRFPIHATLLILAGVALRRPVEAVARRLRRERDGA
jgi:hypothetical protein